MIYRLTLPQAFQVAVTVTFGWHDSSLQMVVFFFRAFANLKHRWDKNGLPPHGLKLVIGSTHAAINRDFVDFILHNQTAKDFMQWLQKTVIPDETFLPTLNYNPQLGIPGSFLGKNNPIMLIKAGHYPPAI